MDVVRATEEQILDAVRTTEEALVRPKSPGARSLVEESERRSTTVRMEGHSNQMPQTSTVSQGEKRRRGCGYLVDRVAFQPSLFRT